MDYQTTSELKISFFFVGKSERLDFHLIFSFETDYLKWYLHILVKRKIVRKRIGNINSKIMHKDSKHREICIFSIVTLQ